LDGAPDHANDTGVSADSGHDADVEPPPDPCPGPGYDLVLDCDPACQKHGPEAECSQVTCGPTVSMTITNINQSAHRVIRPLQAPGVDPNCAAECGPGQLVYGMGFTLPADPLAQRGWVVRVSPPWQILFDGSKPFCANNGAHGPFQCVEGLAPGYAENFFIVTADPSAPARNVTIDQFNGSNGCP
jgi:hypothetical protein